MKRLIYQLLIIAALLSTLFISIKKMEIKQISLPTPHFSQDDILRCKAGLRPYRKSGIRLEPEYLNGKLIIHDYGHGGSGITLSWGSARVSLEILEKELSNDFSSSKEAAILGAGVMGLTTAHLLADKGWKVHVYASQFSPHTTSNIAPGLWNKVLIGEHLDEDQKNKLENILRTSFQDFWHLSQSSQPEFQGVSLLDIYTFKENPPIKNLPKGLFAEGVTLNVIFNNGLKKKGMHFQTFLVDTGLYIPDLFEKAKDKGVLFSQMTFHTQEDLSKLPEKVIFNCTGLGSKELFHDPDLYPIKGELVELKPQPGLNMMLAGPMKREVDLYLIPLHDRLILGGSYEEHVADPTPDQKICDEIVEHARSFFGS